MTATTNWKVCARFIEQALTDQNLSSRFWAILALKYGCIARSTCKKTSIHQTSIWLQLSIDIVSYDVMNFVGNGVLSYVGLHLTRASNQHQWTKLCYCQHLDTQTSRYAYYHLSNADQRPCERCNSQLLTRSLKKSASEGFRSSLSGKCTAQITIITTSPISFATKH